MPATGGVRESDRRSAAIALVRVAPGVERVQNWARRTGLAAVDVATASAVWLVGFVGEEG